MPGGVSISIEVTRDTAEPAVRAFCRAFAPEQIRPVVGRSATNTIREHLFGLNATRPNGLGGARTNFYAQAARATHFDITAFGNDVIVSINQVGIAQRYFGGAITPKAKKYLTIPARAEAYGKRASEFHDLVLVFGKGGLPIALARAAQTRISYSKDGKVHRSGSAGGEILFWLVKKVTQAADPTVLPYDELLYARIERDLKAYAAIVEARIRGGNN